MLVAKVGAICARGVAAIVGLALGLGAGMPAAHAAGILDAPCKPGQKLIVKDYQGATIASNGRGMAAFARGKDAAAVNTDYLMLVWSKNSGRSEGGITFYNWGTTSAWTVGQPPKANTPSLRFKISDSRIREAHSTPVTEMFANDWRTWVLQATDGFSVYNLDSVAAPVLVKNEVVAGAANTDYSGGAVWFLALAAPTSTWRRRMRV